jgi:serpin B
VTAFAEKLFAQVRRGPGNVLVSPPALRLALAIPFAGARGDTAREMAAAIALPADTRAETAAWQDAKGQSELSVASKLWVDKSEPVRAEFAEPYERVDFAHAPDDARRAMDAWVDKATAHRIPQLLGPGALDARARLVVTSAVYMKARWSLPFAPPDTRDEAFHVDGKTTKNVPTMHGTESRAYAEAGGARVVTLPYEKSDLAMVLVLHDDPKDESIPEDALAALGPRRVALSLPRFSFKSGAKMTAVLAALGVRAALTDAADFSGITDKRDVAISEVVQKTWIAVDEQGTEAAAATGVVMRTTSLVVAPAVEMKLDRPFLFLVRDQKRGRILFVGRVADPTQKGE